MSNTAFVRQEFSLDEDITLSLKDLGFYKYLQNLPCENGIVEFIPSIQEYLSPMGYSTSTHSLARKTLEMFRFCYGEYVRLWVSDTTQFEFDDLFEFIETPNAEGYYCQHEFESLEGFTISWKEGKYIIKPKLKALVDKLSIIYRLNPQNYFFEIQKDKLIIRYQFILGSRTVCNLKIDSDSDGDL